MSVYKRGETWWYKFYFAGSQIRESAKTHSKTLAQRAENTRRRELEQGYNGVSDQRVDRVRTIDQVAHDYLDDYRLRHKSTTFAEYAVANVVRHLGDRMIVEIAENVVTEYQTRRLREKAAPKTVNEEVGFLLRLLGDAGDLIRSRLRKRKALKLTVPPSPGRPYSDVQKEKLMSAAREARSRFIFLALSLAFNAGLRDAEIRNLKWICVDFAKQVVTVGQSKTPAGTGRTIPLNDELSAALIQHRIWFVARFGEARPEWFLFPFGKANQLDPTRPVTTLKTAWNNVRSQAGVVGRFHDARHTWITELAEGGAGEQTIMDMAGHVSRQMLSRYSHIGMKAKREAVKKVGTHTQPTQSDGRV